ncbi:MoaF C-terminal domain-containing protein [Aeromicrobium sp. 9AM]|uniref:MoaF C-terminal domain-containing protein n=1 Tax=Aeromicrobium sp. 9AM TaxID=2653126 RepID=UPI0012F2C508|nr:MoaF C-terminal domain-containing protein [Aeromicrobium sp. 9AM]VXB63487.1 Molybdenum cofactor biosynthesis protein MoaF [Aeromicrobium sp. 9AM]
MTTDLSDTTAWLPLDGLAPGFDANKAVPTADLAGRTIVTIAPDGTRVSHLFTDTRVAWAFDGGEAGDDAYEAFEVDAGLYFVQAHHTGRPTEALSLVVDLVNGRGVAVVTAIGTPSTGTPEPGKSAVKQSFTPVLIEGIETSGLEPGPSTALIGRRTYWVYSEVHAYEHIYLSPQWYTWQCLAGPERGLADTDLNTVWEIRPGIHIFAWREKVIPCASVTIADHRNQKALRSHGVLFGLDETGSTPTHFTFGAHGHLLSNTIHPDIYDPAG